MTGRGPEPEEPDDGPPPGTVRPTGPGVLVALAVIGLVAGWSVRLLCLRNGWTEPQVSFASILLIWFCAAVLGTVAYVTQQTVRRARGRLAPHHAVNRLVLGKASALAGALVGGGYLGFALSQLGSASDLAGTRLWHALLAGVGGLVVMVTALLLERACRVPEDDD